MAQQIDQKFKELILHQTQVFLSLSLSSMEGERKSGSVHCPSLRNYFSLRTNPWLTFVRYSPLSNNQVAHLIPSLSVHLSLSLLQNNTTRSIVKKRRVSIRRNTKSII